MKKTYEVGQELALMMLKPNNSKMPFSKTENGIICLIEKSLPKKYYEYNSTWLCVIKEVKENVLIIEPIEMLKTSQSNLFELQQKIDKIKEQQNKNKKIKKPKNNYQFKSKIEMNKGLKK